MAIKNWEKTFSFPLHIEVLEKRKKLEDIQEAVETVDVQLKFLQREHADHGDYIKSLKDEEIIWRIKSIILWL